MAREEIPSGYENEEPSTCSCEDCRYELLSPEDEPCCKCKNSYLNYFEPKTSEATEMTNEKCKEVLQALWRYKDCGYSENEIRNSLEMAIKLLEQNPCEDAVSRQAVFDEIQATYDTDGITDDANGIDYVDKEELEDFISKLPPVAPTRKKGRGVGMTREELLKEIDRERKWLDEAGYTAYNIDIVFSSLYKNIKVLETEPCEDAISRKAILNMYECLDEESRVYAGQVVRDIKALPPVEPTREKGNWIDAVSRKAVFEVIDDSHRDGFMSVFCSYKDGERFKDYIKELPSVTPIQSWILVRDNLPIVGEDVLICDLDGDMYISYLHTDNEWGYDECGNKLKNIIAWQPLPIPYKAEMENEE